MPENILILGLGNDILTDDAIGPKLVMEIQNEIHRPDIDFLTVPVGGMDLLEMISPYQRIIILDAIRTRDGKAGEVYSFTTRNFKETLHLSSFHDLTFLTALEFAESVNMPVPEVINIIAVEIVDDLTFSNCFSPELQEKFPEIRKTVFALVAELI